MRTFISCVAAALLVCGAAGVFGREAGKMRTRLESAEPATVAQYGGSNVVAAAKAAGYDADALCDLGRAVTNWAMVTDALSDATPEKARSAAMALMTAGGSRCGVAHFLRQGRMMDYLTAADWEALASMSYLTNEGGGLGLDDLLVPEMLKRHAAVKISDEAITVDALVTLILDGGRYKSLGQVNAAKDEIKRRCAGDVKGLLRKEGKTFVARTDPGTGVVTNPIEERMKPVVDALNAPACAGLEGALRGFGYDVPDKDRTVLRKAAKDYADAIMRGSEPANANRSGSIAVLLGPDGYNAWVREYNEGKCP